MNASSQKRFDSKTKILGVPLVSVAKGGSARGIIAVGDVATGVIAVGRVAIGGIAIGAIGLGLVTVAGVAIGGLALGGIAIGGGATGGVAIGEYARGGVALGHHVMAPHQRDPEAVKFFEFWTPGLKQRLERRDANAERESAEKTDADHAGTAREPKEDHSTK